MNDVVDFHMTPLIRAVMGKNERCVQKMIEAGADVNYFDEEGAYCALSLASEKSHELVQLLIRAGADVNIPSAEGGTLAFSSYSTIDSACVLLREGAKINIFNGKNVNNLKRYIAKCFSRVDPRICMILFAAGEILDATTLEGKDFWGRDCEVSVPNYLLFDHLKMNLKHLCREIIRKHLLGADMHTHLFGRVPQLGLPKSLTEYVLYGQTLDKDKQIRPHFRLYERRIIKVFCF